MALISVAELLYDPDFIDPCVVLRQVQTVDEFGVGRFAVQRIPILASIQAASGDELVMTTDMTRTEGTYEVITTFPLATATDTTAADIVQWRGAEFVVMSIGRFGNFANNAGHYEGVMTIKTISPGVGPP